MEPVQVLHRQLTALGATNHVIRQRNWDDQHTRVKTDRTDALSMLTALDRFCAGNPKALALVALLRQLASYMQVACNEDLALLLSNAFPIPKPQRNPIDVLPAPAILTVGFGARTGELTAVATPVFGAAFYNWRATTATAPKKWMRFVILKC